MGHQLKLDIFTFTIVPRYQQGDVQELTYEEFYKSQFIYEDENEDEVNKLQLYRRFVEAYTQLFDGRFAINRDETKGVYVNNLRASPDNNCFDGILNGGLTGIKQFVYRRDNPNDFTDEISLRELTTLPHYMKIWTPFDGTIGVIMVQIYSNNTVTSLALDLLRRFFANRNITVRLLRHVPEDYKEYFKAHSVVQELHYVRQELGRDSRNRLSPILVEENDMRIQIKLSNLHLSGQNLDDLLARRRTINLSVPELGIDENEEYQTIAIYKDPRGHQSKMNITQNIDIMPTIYLDDNLKENLSQNVDYDRVKNHTDEILQTVQIEIGYRPED